MSDPWDDNPYLNGQAAAERQRWTNGNGNYLDPIWVDDDPWMEEEIQKRPWVAHGYALRGSVTIVAGPPSALKSSLMLAWSCAVILGKEHGNFRPCDTGNVIVYNVEDDKTEQRRRLSAVLRQFNASPHDIQGKLVRVGPGGVGTLFERTENGKLNATSAMTQLRSIVEVRRPALLIVDPLAELHAIDENDNTALRAVIAAFRAIAVEFELAVIVVHHTRKGLVTPGDPDSARGASAIIGAARVALTLVGMSEGDADELGMPKDRKSRAQYVRLDDAKQNYAGIGDAQWYTKELYLLNNGEMIPAASPWRPPDIWQAIPVPVANRILDIIDAGIDGGKQRYSDAPAATDRAAWRVVTKIVPSHTEPQARKIIQTWVQKEVLRHEDYDDPVARKPRCGLFVNDANRPGNR